MLADTFRNLKERGEKALVAYVTAGDPELDQLPAILLALQEGGADIIEVGIPFSDPIGDGPTIQASSQRALDRGVTPDKIFETLAKVELRVPLVFMCYCNTVMRTGVQNFAERSRKVRVQGVILVDGIPEVIEPWTQEIRGSGLDIIYLAAPTSTDQRLAVIAGQASGFIYVVSRTGVTGAETHVPPAVSQLIGRLRGSSDLPLCVGFGISTAEHVRMVCETADGAVVGSAIVSQLAENWQGGKGKETFVNFVKRLKEGTR